MSWGQDNGNADTTFSDGSGLLVNIGFHLAAYGTYHFAVRTREGELVNCVDWPPGAKNPVFQNGNFVKHSIYKWNHATDTWELMDVTDGEYPDSIIGSVELMQARP